MSYINFRGVYIPKKLFKKGLDEKLTLKDIETENNLEIRSILIVLYGTERFLRDSSAALCADVELDHPGVRLLELDFGNRKVKFLELINATIEPGADKLDKAQRIKSGLTAEGFKKYYLSVPSDLDYKKVSDYVGWTFGLKPGEYSPIRES